MAFSLFAPRNSTGLAGVRVFPGVRELKTWLIGGSTRALKRRSSPVLLASTVLRALVSLSATSSVGGRLMAISSGSALAEPGWLGDASGWLLWGEVLVIAQVYDVLEHGRAWRQVVGVQEQRVEIKVTLRGVVDHGAAFECARVVFGVVHAHERTVVVEIHAAPIFRKAQEVVQSSVGSEVLRCATEGRLRERNVLTSRYGHTVIGGAGVAAGHVVEVSQAVQISPSGGGSSDGPRTKAGEQRDGVADDGCGRMLGVVAAAG